MRHVVYFSVLHVRSHMPVYPVIDVLKEKGRPRTGLNRLKIPDTTCHTFIVALRNIIEITGE